MSQLYYCFIHQTPQKHRFPSRRVFKKKVMNLGRHLYGVAINKPVSDASLGKEPKTLCTGVLQQLGPLFFIKCSIHDKRCL